MHNENRTPQMQRILDAYDAAADSPTRITLLSRAFVVPHNMESILRADILMNEAEGVPCGVKAQVRVKDTSGVKPYLVLDATINPITGYIDLALYDDGGMRQGGSFGAQHLRDRNEYVVERFALAYVASLLERDGYTAAAEHFNVLLKKRRGLGWRECTAQLHARLADLYLDAPPYESTEFVHRRQLVPGQWYCAVEAPNGVFRYSFFAFADYGYGCDDTSFEVYLRCQDDRHLVLTMNGDEVVNGPYWDDSGVRVGREDMGRIFPVSEELVREVEAFVSPRFDESCRVVIGMPVWSEPLDTVERCLARLQTRQYAFDFGQYRQAVLFLYDHRGELSYDVSITIPDLSSDRIDEAEKAKWREVAQNTKATCGCGEHRAIVATKPADTSAPDCSRAFVLAAGMRAYIVPKGAPRTEALIGITMEAGNDGAYFVTLARKPFSDVMDLSLLLVGPRGFPLRTIAEGLPQNPEGLSLKFEGSALLTFVAADLDAATATFVPSNDMEVME